MQYSSPLVAVLFLLSSVRLSAQDPAPGTPPSDDSGWVRAWMRVAAKARESQPHFVAPIVTTHVMLVQQYRYDMSWQQDPAANSSTANYGTSKGLEIIPTTRLEVGIFPPSYLAHQPSLPDGFG